MTKVDVAQLLNNNEDGFIERKTEGAANGAEIRKALVAFANSVPEGQVAVLFIGIANDGTPTGVSNTDSIQRTVDEASRDCYPPVKHQSQAFKVNDKDVVAVIVEASSERPHFAGPAYVRIGSQSKAASKGMYEELIASRNTKAGQILRNKEGVITLDHFYKDRPSQKVIREKVDCRIEGGDAHVVRLYHLSSGSHLSYSLEDVKINRDEEKYRMMLQVGPEAAHSR